MPHIRQNRSRWLMRYEYGATVNAPSKKGPRLRQGPFIYGKFWLLPVTRPAQDRGAMVALANGNCGRVRTGADSASG